MTISPPLIYFFTDFGAAGPYLGQMEAAILSETLQARIINLCSNAPCCDPKRASYLLAALVDRLPRGAIVVCVVDPGVGGDRRALLVETERLTLVGPDNGLLVQALKRQQDVVVKELLFDPTQLSASFHGRDLFSPVAANIAKGQPVACRSVSMDGLVGMEWPAQLGEVIYIDHYGNVFTGLAADEAAVTRSILCGERTIRHGHTFSSVPHGEAFWYANSSGLLEIAVNGGRADEVLGMRLGDTVAWSA